MKTKILLILVLALASSASAQPGTDTTAHRIIIINERQAPAGIFWWRLPFFVPFLP